MHWSPLGKPAIQLCSLYTPLPPCDSALPSKYGALMGSCADLPQFQ